MVTSEFKAYHMVVLSFLKQNYTPKNIRNINISQYTQGRIYVPDIPEDLSQTFRQAWSRYSVLVSSWNLCRRLREWTSWMY